jgi:glycosyltransferase involved in cell wall biosynthesis
LNVLFLNHTSEVSGAERSLLDLLAALPASVRATAASPPGQLQTAIADLGIPTSTITGTAGSLRLHPLHTPRALAEMAFAARQLRGIARRQGAQLVHANSIRAGIIAGLAHLPRAATVVHVRDCLPPGPPATATMRLIAATATTVVANSRYTADCVRASAPRARPRVVYNAVDLERWSPARVDRGAARASLGAPGERGLLLGVVAQLTPWKGQDTAIEALKLLRDDGVDAQLLLIGSIRFRDRATRFDNGAYVRRLRELVSAAQLEDRVCWLGEREDVPALMGALDVLLLPSWEEPFGRASIEAMAMGVPVIATEVGGPPEIIENGREGLLLPPRIPSAWARAIGTLAGDSTLRAKMGRAGRERVQQAFTIDHHVSAMIDLYSDTLAASRQARSEDRHASNA